MFIKQENKAFTLLEIIVVVAIIGLLSAVIFSIISSARAKGRDAKRVSDIRQINTAIGMYQNDHAGNPPDLGNPSCVNFYTYDPSCFASSETGIINWQNLKTQLEPYLKILPEDPCPSCTALDIFINKVFAFENFEYVYHAPAAVNAYLIDHGMNPTDFSQNQTYSIFASTLEKTDNPFGFGLSVSSVAINNNPTDDPNTMECPYTEENDNSEVLCKQWDLCNQGEDYYCKILEEYNISISKECPYIEDENSEELCKIWNMCKEGDKESCEKLNSL